MFFKKDGGLYWKQGGKLQPILIQHPQEAPDSQEKPSGGLNYFIFHQILWPHSFKEIYFSGCSTYMIRAAELIYIPLTD